MHLVRHGPVREQSGDEANVRNSIRASNFATFYLASQSATFGRYLLAARSNSAAEPVHSRPPSLAPEFSTCPANANVQSMSNRLLLVGTARPGLVWTNGSCLGAGSDGAGCCRLCWTANKPIGQAAGRQADTMFWLAFVIR